MRCLVGLVSVLAVSSAALSIPPRPQQVVLEKSAFLCFRGSHDGSVRHAGGRAGEQATADQGHRLHELRKSCRSRSRATPRLRS